MRSQHDGHHGADGHAASVVLEGVNHRVIVHFPPRCFHPQARQPVNQSQGNQPQHLRGAIAHLRFRRTDEQPEHHHGREGRPAPEGPQHRQVGHPVIASTRGCLAILFQGDQFRTALHQGEAEEHEDRESQQPGTGGGTNGNRTGQDAQGIQQR